MPGVARLSVWLGLFGAAASCAPPPVAGQSSDPRLAAVFDDWQRRHERVPAVRYHVRGERRLPAPPAPAANQQPPGNPTTAAPEIVCPLERTFLLDFAAGRHRLEFNDQAYDRTTGDRFPDRIAVAFGPNGFQGRRWPRDEEPGGPPPGTPLADLGFTSGVSLEPTFPSRQWPLLAGHGLIDPTSGFTAPGPLPGRPDRERFTLHGEAVHDGRPCLILRARAPHADADNYDEFWIDPARASAIVRERLLAGGHVSHDVVIHYQQTSHGWLVRDWTFTVAQRGVPVFEERLRVEAVTINPAVTDADFQFAEEPGMLIVHSKAGGWPDPKRLMVFGKENQYFRVGPDGRRHEVTFADGAEHPVDAPGDWWPLGVALGALLLVAALGWYQPWKSPRTTPG